MTASPSAGEQRKFLANTIKPGGVAGVPESYYRKALDLNRFSNSVANKLLESYRRQIVKAVRQLERIDKMPSSKKPQFKAARMRALIKQNLDAMKKWSGQSVEELIKQLDGLADIEVAFAKAELQRAVPAAVKTQVRTVEVTESFAKAVVKADPLDVGTNLLQGSFEEAVKGPGSVMKLTARQGAVIRMPDGTSIVKAFRGLAERQGELFSRAVLDGLLTGESTESIARSLYGELGFSTEALTPRQVALAQKGNAWKMAKHQVRTLVRTSVNATSNAASLQVYKANPKLTKKYRWIATLDSNTTAICRNLDQQEFFYGKGPTPANPPHFACRSTTVPVIDYAGASKRFGVEIKPPSSKIGYRPTKEGTPSSADPKGGRVPVGTSAAQHLYDLRGTTKAGKKSRFDASPAQARMLNGGRATPGAFEKARYFNRLADRYGPEGAMKRFMREDGSEVSLKQLRSRYGQPDKITRGKKVRPPKPVAPVGPSKADREQAAVAWSEGKYDEMMAGQYAKAKAEGKSIGLYGRNQADNFNENLSSSEKKLRAKQAADLDAAIKTSKDKFEGKIYRGVGLHSKDEVDEFLKGLDGESPTLASWTRSQSTAAEFASGYTQVTGGPITHRVLVRRSNKDGVAIEKLLPKTGTRYLGNVAEKEVLMPSGVRTQVAKVQRIKKKDQFGNAYEQVIVDLEDAPEPTTKKAAARVAKSTAGPIATTPKAGPGPRQFIEEHTFGQKQKISNTDLANSLEIFAKEDSEVGRNFSKMLEFMQKKNISVVWSNGREKVFGKGPNFDHWNNPALIQSMKDAIKRAPNAQGTKAIQNIVNDLEANGRSISLARIGKVSGNAAGHTLDGAGFVVMKQASRHVPIKAREVARTKEAVLRSVEDAAAGRPKFVTNSDLYSVTGKTTVGTKDGWMATLVHEIGHQVHFNAGKPSIMQSLKKANPGLSSDKLSRLQLELEIRKANWVPSKYGTTNGMEQFAETFVQYVFAPSALKKANPAAYSWIDAALEEGLK